MSRTRCVESRALDNHYDTIFATSTVDNAKYRSHKTAVDPTAGSVVGGSNAYLFTTRPVVPHLYAVPSHVLLAPTQAADPLEVPVDEPEPFTRDAGTQTKYRESEAQTDAFTPAYTIDPSKEPPEILMLAGLTQEDGLPIGLREVEMFEHAREKRLMEASLPPFTDEASLALRKKLMEGQEMKELRLRSLELERAREERLALLKRAMDERDQGNEFMVQQRIEALRQSKVEERERHQKQLQQRRIKVLRKLTKARESLSDGGHKKGRDIIEEYANCASAVYAPIQREGRRLDRDAIKFDVLSKTAPITTFDAIVDMEHALPPSMTRAPIPTVKPVKSASTSQAARRALAVSANLTKLDALIKSKRAGTAQGVGGINTMTSTMGLGKTMGDSSISLQETRKKVQRRDRPTTPSVPEVEGEPQALALLLLRRLLRGRSVQNAMYEGKERRRELIKELKSANESPMCDGGTPGAKEMSDSVALEARRQRVVNSAMETVVASAIVAALQEITQSTSTADETTKKSPVLLPAESSSADQENSQSPSDKPSSPLMFIPPKTGGRDASQWGEGADVATHEIAQGLVASFLQPYIAGGGGISMPPSAQGDRD